MTAEAIKNIIQAVNFVSINIAKLFIKGQPTSSSESDDINCSFFNSARFNLLLINDYQTPLKLDG